MLEFQPGKNCKITEESHANYMFGWLPLSQPNVPKIDGMFKLQLLTFCFDLINKNLPAFFITMYLLKNVCVFVFRIF